jgi:hypothetical protein
VVVEVVEFSFTFVFLFLPFPFVCTSLVPAVVVEELAPVESVFESVFVASVFVVVFLPFFSTVVVFWEVDCDVSCAASAATLMSDMNTSLFIVPPALLDSRGYRGVTGPLFDSLWRELFRWQLLRE